MTDCTRGNQDDVAAKRTSTAISQSLMVSVGVSEFDLLRIFVNLGVRISPACYYDLLLSQHLLPVRFLASSFFQQGSDSACRALASFLTWIVHSIPYCYMLLDVKGHVWGRWDLQFFGHLLLSVSITNFVNLPIFIEDMDTSKVTAFLTHGI